MHAGDEYSGGTRTKFEGGQNLRAINGGPEQRRVGIEAVGRKSGR